MSHVNYQPKAAVRIGPSTTCTTAPGGSSAVTPHCVPGRSRTRILVLIAAIEPAVKIGTLACGTGGCETVQLSQWSRFGGLEVSLIGLLGYAVLLGLTVACARCHDHSVKSGAHAAVISPVLS